MDWILLNKDPPFLEFSTQEDEFGDVVAMGAAHWKVFCRSAMRFLSTIPFG